MKNLPKLSMWFICYVDGERMPLKFNEPNCFWVGMDGKTYDPEKVIWVNDLSFSKQIPKE